MNTVQGTSQQIADYMHRLEAALRKLAPSEREDILREIRAHILDSTEGSADPERATGQVLRLLGSPDELANRYVTESLLARAGSSFSPWLLLQTCWRWAKIGVKGTTAFLVGFTGYSLAIALTITVLLKPLLPSRIGMWVGPGSFVIGVPGDTQGMHEVLGQNFAPLAALAAFLIGAATTLLVRSMIQRREPNANRAG